MKRLLFISLALCFSMMTMAVRTTAQPGTSDLQKQIGEANLTSITSLVFDPGSTINSYDIMIMRNRMTSLTYLDMSEVTIVANNHEYYTGYHSENDVLGPYAFYEVKNLETVILPKSITYIGNNAFGNCAGYIYSTDGSAMMTPTGLKTVVFPDGSRIARIGYGAFSNCSNLQSINFPEGLESIESSAFSMCSSLTSVEFPPSLTRIESSAFMSCNSLNNVRFLSYSKSRLREIGSSAFSWCSSLGNIKLPPRLRIIGSEAFSGCSNLRSLRLPGWIKKIQSNAFRDCNNLNDIYPQTLIPVPIDQTTFSTYETANIHLLPYRYSKMEYYWNTEWNQFLNLHSSSRRSGTRGDESEDDIISTTVCFYIPDGMDYEFADGDIRIEGEPDAELNSGSGLIVVGDVTQNLGEVRFMADNSESCSVIGNNNISAKKVYFDLTLTPNQWHFMTFPFKVRISDIICKGNYVFRYYDSETRAQNGTSGWKDLPEGEEFLYPGRGYIFQTDYTSGNYMGTGSGMMGYQEPDPTISIPVETENISFSGADKANAIVPYPSSCPENASWNFMGNPYPSYFDLDETNYEGPITIWNGTGYESIRKGDDVYHFRPLEGFFIQKPENVSEMLFLAAGRHTFSQWAEIQAGKNAARAAATRAANSRQLINLTLSDGSYTDKTRVVFTPQSIESYEIGTDASKFMATNKAQLYSVDSKAVRYAINERPNGEVRLGFVAVKSGEMTISASRMDMPVALYDKQLDMTFDLNKGDYTFTTEAGTFNDRFLLIRAGNATRIDAVSAKGAADAPVYSIDGRRVEQMKANRVYITEGKKVIKK